jgi:hypothetical protein
VNDQHHQSGEVQAVDTAGRRAGKARVKPRHLSTILRQVIVDQFRACHSTEDIAEDLKIPARTVSDVLLAEALRRPLQPERGAAMPVMVRRTA